MFNQTGNSFTQKINIEGGGAGYLDESGTVEEELEKILKNKQAKLEIQQLDDEDPLKKLVSNFDQINKQHQN